MDLAWKVLARPQRPNPDILTQDIMLKKCKETESSNRDPRTYVWFIYQSYNVKRM